MVAQHQQNAIQLRIDQFLEKLKNYDLSLIQQTRLSDKTQFEQRHQALKKKGGNPPVDYSVAEMVADLHTAHAAGEFRESALLYLRLTRILNF